MREIRMNIEGLANRAINLAVACNLSFERPQYFIGNIQDL
jgi:hypothetical protein